MMAEQLGATMPVQKALDDLRKAGAPGRDPLRFCYLETLARRALTQTDPVRRCLEQRLTTALAQWQTSMPAPTDASGPQLPRANAYPREAATRSTAKPNGARGSTTGLRLLVALNHDLRKRSHDPAAVANIDGSPNDPGELRSARAFKQEWSQLRAQERVQTALDGGPDNAGPLNSHQLVLRAASQMRSLSPIYLERFLSHVDTLLWLDGVQLQSGATDSASTPGRRKRQKK